MFSFVYSLGCTGFTLCDLLMLDISQIDDGFPSITEWQTTVCSSYKSDLSVS